MVTAAKEKDKAVAEERNKVAAEEGNKVAVVGSNGLLQQRRTGCCSGKKQILQKKTKSVR